MSVPNGSRATGITRSVVSAEPAGASGGWHQAALARRQGGDLQHVPAGAAVDGEGGADTRMAQMKDSVVQTVLDPNPDVEDVGKAQVRADYCSPSLHPSHSLSNQGVAVLPRNYKIREVLIHNRPPSKGAVVPPAYASRRRAEFRDESLIALLSRNPANLDLVGNARLPHAARSSFVSGTPAAGDDVSAERRPATRARPCCARGGLRAHIGYNACLLCVPV